MAHRAYTLWFRDMTRQGHIQLNGEPYLIDIASYQSSPANPFAAKLGNGLGDYDDLEDWAGWLMDDWRSGVGKLPSEGGGFLYGTCDTRFKNKLFLSQDPVMVSLYLPTDSRAGHSQPPSISGTWTIGPSQNITALRVPRDEVALGPFWFYVAGDAGTVVDVKTTRADGSTVAASGSFTLTEEMKGYHWYSVSLSTDNGGITKYIELHPQGNITIPYSTEGLHPTALWVKSGLSWVQQASTTGWYILDYSSITYQTAGTGGSPMPWIGRLSGDIWCVSKEEGVARKIEKTGANWQSTTGVTSSVITQAVDALVFNEHIYIATDIQDVYRTNNGTFYSGVDQAGQALAKWNNFLYVGYDNGIAYSTDGTTFTGPITVCPTDYSVRGMAGLDSSNDIYVACDDGLYKFSEGDFTFGVFPFGTISADNGRGMINFQGDLYIPADGTIYRYSANGTIVEVGISTAEDLPAERIGKVQRLAAAGSWLLASVDPAQTGGSPTVWAYNSEGWHHIATLPPGMGAGPMYADRENGLLWIGTDRDHVFYIPWKENGQNPLRVDGSRYMFTGWLETDWYYGGLREIDKDWESVYISGEDLGDDQTVKVYWQDDASTGWELLGTFDTEREEIRWSNSLTRPNSKQIKIGILLQTNDSEATPVVRAVRIKYHNMVNDRLRWNVRIRAENDMRMVDGSISDRTPAEIRADIDELIRSVPPIVLEDIDETEYNVKIQQAYSQIKKYEYINGDATYESMHSLTLVEV